MSPSYKTTFGSYLKQEDLQGKAIKVVIESVDLEEIKDQDTGKTEKKLVMHFQGKDKTLIVNKTNCETLEQITGTDDYDAWGGWQVVLFSDPTVKFGGKTVGGLRIRAVSSAVKPPPPPVVEEEEDDPVPF
jgi:hypothetical protein